MIEVGTREAKAALVEAGSHGTPGRPVGALGEGRRLEPEWSRARARIPQVVRGREGEGTAVATRVQQPGPQLAIWTDVVGGGGGEESTPDYERSRFQKIWLKS